MRIYISSSTANMDAVRELQMGLSNRGHYVFDWMQHVTKDKDHDPDGRLFALCSQSCAGADLIIYLAPSGEDSACELGMAHAAGVPVWAVLDDEKKGLMVRGCITRIFTSTQRLLSDLSTWRGW